MNRLSFWEEYIQENHANSLEAAQENEVFGKLFDSSTNEQLDIQTDNIIMKEFEMTDKSTDEVIKEAIRADDLQDLVSMGKPNKANNRSAEAKQSVSLKFGVVGSGQAGGRIAEVFHKFGYSAVAINTALQDLELINIPADSRLHMNYSIGGGGSGKNLDVGREAIEDSLDAVKILVADKLNNSDVYVATFSLGGGSGSGSAETLINLLSEFGKPICVIAILPGSFDDTQSKHNAIQTLSRLADQASSNKINSLILVDNAQIEKAFPMLAQSEFWKVSNEAAVKPLHTFNSMSARPSKFESLDSMDFTRALLEAGGCTVFGSNRVQRAQYESNELALVEAIVDNLEHGLLASGFDLKEAAKVGVLVSANEAVLSRIPHSNISFIFKYISEEWGSAASFRGVYASNAQDDTITVDFIFSGLGLPKVRVDDLKTEAKKSMDMLEAKKTSMVGKMSIDLGSGKSTSAADNMMAKIKKNKSALGKLLGNSNKGSVIDRRR